MRSSKKGGMRKNFTTNALSSLGAPQQRPRVKRIHSEPSFGNLNTKLVHTVKSDVVARMKKERALQHSSAFKRPNAPVVTHTIPNQAEFHADEIFGKMIEHGVHGIPVYDESKSAFVGCVELVAIGYALQQGKDATPIGLESWMAYLRTPEASAKVFDMCSSVNVHIVSEDGSLFDVAAKMMAPTVHRVFLHDANNPHLLVATISESDLVSYFHAQRSHFALADGSEIPWMANEMAGDGHIASNAAINSETITLFTDESLADALVKLFESKLYSLPVCTRSQDAQTGNIGQIVNSFCVTDLKNFFYQTDQLDQRSWDETVQSFLGSGCGKDAECREKIASSNLGVPVTRVLEIMSVVNVHTVFITSMEGVPIGQMGVTDICAFIATDIHLVTPSASPMPGLDENKDDMSFSDLRQVDMDSSITTLPRVGSVEAGIPSLERKFSDVDITAESPGKGSPRKSHHKSRLSLKHELTERTLRFVAEKNVRNKIQLITYPDCFGGNLFGLKHVLDKHLGGDNGVIGGVHILPFYPSSADRGFAPQDYQMVDPNFGDWGQIRELAAEYDVLVDFMVNHISQQSKEFQDFLDRRDDSPYADLFIRYKNFWPHADGEPTKEDLALIYTRKPRAPYFDAQFRDGKDPPTEKVWCTFDFEQIDLDVTTETGRAFIRENLEFLCQQGVKFIRLDAFGYATKKYGTRCFMEEPEVWDLLKWLGSTCRQYNVEILAEIHEHYTIQMKLSQLEGSSYWVYDFALPMLLLQSLYDSNCSNLEEWLKVCPHNQLTTLDTHDGIGVVDVKDLMTNEESTRTYNNLYQYGANVKRIYSSAQYTNLDIYQINCTYYSAVGNNDEWYLLCRAVQFFAPGIPQVYYVGLMCGENDIDLIEQTRVGRDINRHNYSLQEVDEEISKRRVVQRLFQLCRFRNSYPAFGGDFAVMVDENDAMLRLKWTLNSTCYTTLVGNFETKEMVIMYYDAVSGGEIQLDV